MPTITESMSPEKTAAGLRLANLLFATDFSEDSRRALPQFRALARQFHPRLYVAHVVAPNVNGYLPGRIAVADWDAQKQAACKKMADLLSGPELKALRPEGLVTVGGDPDSLLQVIREKKIDLVVLGTHGRTGFRRVVMGSFAEAVVRSAPCAVLTVGPHIAYGHQDVFRHILFPTDMSPQAMAAAPYAVSLAKEYSAMLTILHVLPQETATNPEAKRLTEDLRAEIDRLSGRAQANVRGETLIAFGEAVSTILQTSKRQEADLVVLGVRPAPFIPQWRESIAYGVIARSRVPVITVQR